MTEREATELSWAFRTREMGKGNREQVKRCQEYATDRLSPPSASKIMPSVSLKDFRSHCEVLTTHYDRHKELYWGVITPWTPCSVIWPATKTRMRAFAGLERGETLRPTAGRTSGHGQCHAHIESQRGIGRWNGSIGRTDAACSERGVNKGKMHGLK